MPYPNNKGADQRSLISAFVVCCLDSIVSVFAISWLSLASVAEKACLNLTLSETPEDRFSHDVAHMDLVKKCQRNSHWYAGNRF